MQVKYQSKMSCFNENQVGSLEVFNKSRSVKKKLLGNSLAVQWLGLGAFTARV